MFSNLKKFVLVSSVMFAGTLGIISPASAKAASTNKNSYVPFEFRVGKHILPAGKYRLDQTTEGSNCYTLRNVESGRTIYVLFPKLNSNDPSRLIFTKEDRGYALKVVG
jgi:hypothetical protein